MFNGKLFHSLGPGLSLEGPEMRHDMRPKIKCKTKGLAVGSRSHVVTYFYLSHLKEAPKLLNKIS